MNNETSDIDRKFCLFVNTVFSQSCPRERALRSAQCAFSREKLMAFWAICTRTPTVVGNKN